jgi:hypothetical protein
MYAWKAYLDAELSYPITVKDSFLTCTGYRRDASNQEDFTGAGVVKRRDMFKISRTVQLMHKIDADIFNQDLYMINNVEVDIEITPHESDFLTIIPAEVHVPAANAVAAHNAPNTNEYVLEITNCRLFVKTIDLMDGLSLDIARKLETQPARYGIRKTMLKQLSILQGTSEYTNVLFTDEV